MTFRFILITLFALMSFSFQVSATELRETQCVPFADSPEPELDEGQQEAQELAFQLYQAKLNACRNDDGSFKQETIQFPPGPRTEETEEISCVAMAEEAYKTAVRNNCDVNRSTLMSCLTAGWDQRDVFDMFDRLQEVDQALPTGTEPDPFAGALGMKLEEHFACPGKAEPAGAIFKAIGCNIVSSVAQMVPFGSIMADKIINSMVPENQRPAPGECVDTQNSCLTQVLWGAIQNVFTNIQGLYDLGKMAIQGIGNAIKSGWDWLVGNDRANDAAADQAAVLARLENDIENNEEAQRATGNWAQRLVRGLIDAAGEGMRDQFSCSKWEGGVSGGGVAGGLYNRVNSAVGGSARCLEAAPNWECASAKQKVQMVCGIAGFIGGEVVTTILTGGAVRGLSMAGRVVSKAAGNGSRVARAALAVGRGTRGLARGVLAAPGKGISIVSNLGSKAARSTGGLALKVGDRIMPMTQRLQLMYMQQQLKRTGPVLSATANAVKAGAKTVTWPVRKYLDVLDRAYMLGRYGNDGAFALKNLSKASSADEVTEALQSGMMSKNLNRKNMLPDEDSFRAASEGNRAFNDLTTAQTQLQDAQQAFLDAVKAARKGANGPNAQSLIDEADAAFLNYKNAKNALGPLDEAYTRSLAQHQARLAEEARLAQEAAEREARELAERQAREAAAQTSPSTQLTTTNGSRNITPARNSSGSRSGTSVQRTVGSTSGNARTVEALTDGTRASADDVFRGNIDYTSQQKQGLLDGMINNMKYENKRVSVYHRGRDTWDDNLFNPRVEGNKLVGNRGQANGELVEVDIDDIVMADVRGSFNGEAFSMPFSLSRSTDPTYVNWVERASDTAQKSSDDIRNMLDEMTPMTQAERTRIASVTTYKLSNGIMPSEVEFLAAIKNSGGYATKKGLPNLEKFREIYRAGSTDEALALLDDLYRGTNSEATQLIRNKVAMMTRRIGNLRDSRLLVTSTIVASDANNALLTGERSTLPALRSVSTDLVPVSSGSTALTRVDDAGTAIVLRQSDDLVPSPGTSLALRSSDDFIVPPVLGRTNGGRIVAAVSVAGMTASALSRDSNQGNRGSTGGNGGGAVVPPPVVPEPDITDDANTINVVGNRCSPKAGAKFDLGMSYFGSPTTCSVHVTQLENGRARRTADDEIDFLPSTDFASNKVEVRWSVTRGTGAGSSIASTSISTDDNETFQYVMASGVEQVKAVLLVDGVEFRSVSCPVIHSEEPLPPCPGTETTDTDDEFDPYDRDVASEDDDIDRAEEFYQQQRHPAPSMFTPIRIPSRSTQYMGTGYF